MRCDAQYEAFGEGLLAVNPRQAFLCFQNALFHTTDPEREAALKEKLASLLAEGNAVPRTAIVICSYQAKEAMIRCIESIRRTTSPEMRRIIVVDNASADGIREYLEAQEDILLQANEENAGFPAGCNQGIRLSEPGEDIFLLNNDTELAEESLFWLRMGLYSAEDVGAVGAVSNRVTNAQKIADPERSYEELMRFGAQNNVPMEQPYEERLRLIGFALLVRRSVLDQTGLLDEAFSPGNYEDDDLSMRILLSGHRLLLCKNAFIYHKGGESFGRDQEKYRALLLKNAGYFRKKWGFSLELEAHVEPMLFPEALLKEKKRAVRVLIVGCGAGSELAYLKTLYPEAVLHATELEKRKAELAGLFAESVACSCFSSAEPAQEPYDYILVKELQEPMTAAVMKKLRSLLRVGGHLLLFIRNAFFLPRLMAGGEHLPEDFSEPAVVRAVLLQLVLTAGLNPTRLDGISADQMLPAQHEALVQEIVRGKSDLSPMELYAWKFLLEAEAV